MLKSVHIELEVGRLGRVIDAPAELLEVLKSRSDDGRRHLEMHGDDYHYIATDRGQELDRKITKDPREAIYWIMRDVVTEMAFRDVQASRVAGEDQRRRIFAFRLSHMAKLDKNWGERERLITNGILYGNPYR